MPQSKPVPRFLPTLTEIVLQPKGESMAGDTIEATTPPTLAPEESDALVTARAQEIAKAYLDQHLPELLEQHMKQLVPQVYSAVHALILESSPGKSHVRSE
jgi:hypothetical protein